MFIVVVDHVLAVVIKLVIGKVVGDGLPYLGDKCPYCHMTSYDTFTWV